MSPNKLIQSRRRAIGLSGLLALLLVSGPFPALTANGQDASLDTCREVLKTGDLDRAVANCGAVAANPDADKSDLKEALQLLGRAYVLRSEEAPAREVMADLIRLEPPTVELSEDEIPTLRKVYYEVRKELSGGYEVEHDPGVHTMAIMGFTNNSLEDRERYAPLEWGISSMLITALQGATELKVIERERLKWILDEHSLQSDPSKVDQSTAIRMGKLLGAQTMLVGQLMVVGDKMRVDARLIDVETSEVLMTEQVTEKAKDLFEIIDKLSLKIAKGVNITANELNQGASPRTSSLDAQLSYSEGLELIEKESYGRAYDKFLEALDYDPAFALAKRKADSIKPYLAVNSADG